MSFSALKVIIDHLRISNFPHNTLPSRIFKEALETIGPCILLLLSASLTLGCVPTAFKHAVVQTFTLMLSNYRLISKFPFMSKILKNIVLKQLQAFLDVNDIGENF